MQPRRKSRSKELQNNRELKNDSKSKRRSKKRVKRRSKNKNPIPINCKESQNKLSCESKNCELNNKSVNITPLYTVTDLKRISKNLKRGITYNHPSNYKNINFPETIDEKYGDGFKNRHILGGGSFGVVYGYDSKNKNKGGIALKMIEGNDVMDAIHEKFILSQLKESKCNDYYARMDYIMVKNLPIFIMNQWDGDLENLINCVDVPSAMYCILQLLKGFKCIYDNTTDKLLYTDLKCKNMLYKLVMQEDAKEKKPLINVVIADIGSFKWEDRDFNGPATFPPPLKSGYAEKEEDEMNIVSGIVKVMWPSVYWGLGMIFLELMGYEQYVSQNFFWRRYSKITISKVRKPIDSILKKENKSYTTILHTLLLLKKGRRTRFLNVSDNYVSCKELIKTIEGVLTKQSPNMQSICGFNIDTKRCSKKAVGHKNEWCVMGDKRRCRKSPTGRVNAPKKVRIPK